MNAVIPENEAERLDALAQYEVLDTLPERDFDDLTLLASHICQAPMALVSLVDDDRQWFKSRVGLDVLQTPRDVSFCAYAIEGDGVFVVPDATRDERFANNPLVTGDAGIRFYAGAPLCTPEGFNIGTLCVIDNVARELSPEQHQALQALSRQVVTQLELRRNLKILSLETSARQKTQAALLESEERYRTLFENTNDLILSASPDGRLLYVNRAWREALGYDESEIAAMNWFDVVPPEERAACEAACRPACGDEARKLETVFLARDGRRLEVEGDLTCRDHDGEIGVQGIFRDVTERRTVERMKSEFVATVSHELRTPLTAILGSLGLILGGVAGEVSEQTRSLIEVARANSERLVRLINDILDIEKIESGAMPLHLQPLQLDGLVRRAIEFNAPYAQTLGVAFALENRVSPDAQVLADADRLIQVLINLLSNAAKFSPRESEVEILIEETQKDSSTVRVSVKDKGAGVPLEFRDRIFHKFAQADASDTRQKGGTGLGLSISKALIEKLGGTIGFDSVPDEGATFYFELPLWNEEI